jgi:hypothetical protein
MKQDREEMDLLFMLLAHRCEGWSMLPVRNLPFREEKVGIHPYDATTGHGPAGSSR